MNLQLLFVGNLNVNMRCLQQRGIPHTIFLEKYSLGILSDYYRQQPKCVL